MKLIGRSLSCCIKDIAEGRVSESDVLFIDAGTRAPDLEVVFAHYVEGFWSDEKDACLEIARRFAEEGKIFQPRLLNDDEVHSVCGGHWIINSFDN